MPKHNYQQLYHTFLGSYINKEQTLAVQYFLEQLYHKFVESYIDQEYILLRKAIL